VHTVADPPGIAPPAAPRTARHLPGRLAAKRTLDVVGAAVLLVVLAPVAFVVALDVAIRDGRPVLYRQQRVGRDGVLFTMVKFRTMAPDADRRLAELADRNQRSGPLFKVADDPRVTRSGRWLRTTSLDELPQLVNVLAGSMSLVGPRPALPEERADFPAELLAREQVRPGLTGPWQLDGRLRSDFDSYRRLDLEYVRTWSIRRDVRLLLRTPGVVIRHAWRRAAIERLEPVAEPSVEHSPPLALDGEPAA
jgi:lipopolysaccharide/colanic/teichoic acid biosynthesis glycosyltransferase